MLSSLQSLHHKNKQNEFWNNIFVYANSKLLSELYGLVHSVRARHLLLMSSESEFRHIKAWCECAFANAFIVENSILSQLKVESGKANEVTQYICGHRACSCGWLKTSHARKIIFYCSQWHEVYAMNYMPNGYLLLSLYVVWASQSLKAIRICKSVNCYLLLAISIQTLLLRLTNRQMSHRYSTAFNRF